MSFSFGPTTEIINLKRGNNHKRRMKSLDQKKQNFVHSKETSVAYITGNTKMCCTYGSVVFFFFMLLTKYVEH